MPQNNEIEIRSDEVQEILSHAPTWMIRWGITAIFLVILSLVALTWIIKYPEIIIGKVYHTTAVPATKLTANVSGRINRINVPDGQIIEANTIIASIETPLNSNGLNYLHLYSEMADSLLINSNIQLPSIDTNLAFGTTQSTLSQLQQVCMSYQFFMNDSSQKIEIENLKNRLSEYKNLIRINYNQRLISRKDLKNAERNFDADKSLYETGAIAKMTLFEEEANYNQKQQAVQSLEQSNVQFRIAIIDMQKQLNSLEIDYKDEKRILRNKFTLTSNTLKNEISNWNQLFIIRSNSSGELVWLSHFAPREYVSMGQALFVVIPEGGTVEAVVQIETRGFGKIEEGQVVRIKLDNYPHQEYGMLEGKVKGITPVANQNLYRVIVEINQELITSHGTRIKYLPEMSGIAEIQTADLTLFERILHNIRKVLDREANLNQELKN